MAVLKQERHIELVPGGAEAFVVTNEMFSATIPAQLPHLNVFVIRVADAADPKRDTLARVANLADLSLVPIGRAAGVASPGASGIEFLSQTVTVRYDTLETANTAAKAFVDRVNGLIQSWILYSTTFVAPDPTPASYTLPRVDPTQVTALINAYTVAKQTRYQKQISKTDADAALSRASADYTYKQNLSTGMDGAVIATTAVNSEMTTVVTQYRSLLTDGNTFYASNTATPGIVGAAAFSASLVTATTNSSAMTSYTTDAASAETATRTYRTNRSNEAASAAAALSSAQSLATAAAQQLTSALATETLALNAVYAVCPDFDKHSIPFVPDTEP